MSLNLHLTNNAKNKEDSGTCEIIVDDIFYIYVTRGVNL